MKLTILTVLLAIATTHLIFAENPEIQEPRAKKQDPSLLQSMKPIPDENPSSIGLSSIAQSIKPFSESKQFKKMKWSKGMLFKAIKSLGVLNVNGVKLVKVSKTFVRKLNNLKSHMIKIRSKRRLPLDSSVYSNGQDKKPQKRVLHDLCEEFVDDIYVLAHADERLAYRVETVRCEGLCSYQTLGLVLGYCVLKTKTMIVYIIDSSNNLVPKTVKAGCACECLTTSV